MEIKTLITSVACVAVSALISGCSNDDSSATNTDELTAFTGGIVTEAPIERVQLRASDDSTAASGFLTRTSMARTAIGGKGTFLWEPGDNVYVQDDSGNFFKGQSGVSSTTARYTFFVKGRYINKLPYVYYYGKSPSLDKREVVIAKDQTQSEFNNTKHFGSVGDCGVAVAKKKVEGGKHVYHFSLDHKASYLCFLPYIDPQSEYASYKIYMIEVTSNNNIAGTYKLSPSGLSGVGNSKTITLNIGKNSSVLTKKEGNTPNIGKSLYMVIAPGMHSLSVKYTFSFTNSVKVMTVTKKYDSRNFEANKIYDIPVSLGKRLFVYGGHNYYMWDAKENYWFGHEWDSTDPWQPTTKDARNENYPKSNADASRWYHEGNGPFEASVNPLFSKLPNANEMAWYVMKGDPHWDNSTKWEAFGEVHTGGIWLKKLSVIARENNKQLADLKLKNHEGVDMRTTYKDYTISPISGKPKDSEISKYFFLPALGSYALGRLHQLGSWGNYWSSSAYTRYGSGRAYDLTFDRGLVGVALFIDRYSGYVAQPFE